MRRWLSDFAHTNRIDVFFYNKNIGKAAIVNKMYFGASSPCDYVVSIDSDMIIPEAIRSSWIPSMVNAIDKGVGLVSTNQQVASAHVYENLTQKEEFLVHKSDAKSWGIAGGCLMMSNADFRKIGGYHVHDVYNADDAIIMQKTCKILNKECRILKDIALIHPQETNELYKKWKFDKAYGKIVNGPNTKGFFDEDTNRNNNIL